MKKAILIIIFGLLLSSNAFAKEIKVYHKDENSISVTKSFFQYNNRQDAIAAKHCAQHNKFVFRFWGAQKYGALDEKGKTTLLFHCNRSNLSKSPITGRDLLWTNYDPNHEFAQKGQEDKKFAKIEEYKKTCSAIGFELGTDKFVDCTLKLFVADNKATTQIVQSSSGAQEIIIRDPDRERRIGTKAFSDFVNGKCQINLLSKNPCQF